MRISSLRAFSGAPAAGSISECATKRKAVAKVAVLACGVQYQLTKKLGLGRPREFLQGAQTDVPWALAQCTEVHLNKVYRRAVRNGVSSRRHIGNTLRSARSEKPGFYLGSTLTITDVMSSFCGSSQVNRSAS